MKIEGIHEFDSPREEVWDLVRDPETVRRLVPGVERLEEVSETEYRGELKVGKGWIKTTYDVAIRVAEETPPERLALDVEGRGSLGDAEGGLRIDLSEISAGRTRMRYAVEVDLGGRAGAMSGMLEGLARDRTRQGLAELDREIEKRRG